MIAEWSPIAALVLVVAIIVTITVLLFMATGLRGWRSAAGYGLAVFWTVFLYNLLIQ